MSEVKLVIRDANEDRSGTVHGSVAEWFIAALSADPVSLTELDAAVDRFALESPERGHFSYFLHAVDAEPWDAGLVVIDLAARLVVIDSTYSSPGPKGTVTRHNIESVEGGTVRISYRLAGDWLFTRDAMNWEATASARRRERAAQPSTDLREIFYGEPMLRSIIHGCLKKFAHRDEIAKRVRLEWTERRRHWNESYAEEPQPEPESLTMHDLAGSEDPAEDLNYRIYYNTIRDIHADWLMTPCAELQDQLPRAVLLHDHDRLSSDMTDREFQWTRLERCPPGISPESHAFQFSGFNTNEIVMYYDYVREVAWACWDGLRSMADAERAALENSQGELDEFICNEVLRLRQVGEEWLDAPWDEDPSRTPRGIINLERRRQPNGGQFHPIDPDCPCCQAMAAMPGIGFWRMDGCNMDDLFAFAYHHETIESWEQDQAEYREFSEQMDQERELAKEWCLPSQFSEPKPTFGDVWRRIVNDGTGEIPLGPRLCRVAHCVVSLVVKLHFASKFDAGTEVEQYLEALPNAYASLQRACEESNKRQLSRNIEPSLSSLLKCLHELTSHLELYLCEVETEQAGPEDDDCETSIGSGTPSDFRWRKVLHVAAELKQHLNSFTAFSDEASHDGLYSDDIPF